jgi:hypothetical protein
MDPGDDVAEVAADYIKILKSRRVIQKFMRH